jgi:hypothetical protein
MRLLLPLFGIAVLAAAASTAHAVSNASGLIVPVQQGAPANQGPTPPKGPLNTLADIGNALRGCWQWPPLEQIKSGMELTIQVSFKRDGQIFGARITHQSRAVGDDERALYHRAMAEALALCSPLPVSQSLGNAIAGRPFTFRIIDDRKQRKV